MTSRPSARHLRGLRWVPSMATLHTAVVRILSCERMAKVEASRYLMASSCSEFCSTYRKPGMAMGRDVRMSSTMSWKLDSSLVHMA